jgi:hypothetical protein
VESLDEPNPRRANPTLEKIEANPLATIETYRQAIARIEAAKDEPSRAEWRGVANRLRNAWRDFQGEDSLHEMAFGEPVE